MDTALIIPFPSVVRVVPAPEAAPLRADAVVVDHDGRGYDLSELFGWVSPPVLREIEGLVPRSGQEAWDMMVRRFPREAAAAIARVAPAA